MWAVARHLGLHPGPTSSGADPPPTTGPPAFKRDSSRTMAEKRLEQQRNGQWRLPEDAGSSGAQAAGFGAEDFDGGLGAAATDPDARAGDEGTEVLAAAEGAGPAGAPGFADTAVAALGPGGPPLGVPLFARGID